MANRQITVGDRENAERLRGIWNAKKKALDLNQIKAAAKLGFNHQSTISQYLNCSIVMNTEVVLKFARLLEVDPARIDPSIRSLVVRELHPASKTLNVACRMEISNLGRNCMKTAPHETTTVNPFDNDVPKGTEMFSVELGTSAYQGSFGLPHESVVYILQDAEPGINQVMYVEEADNLIGFYRYNGDMIGELLLTDPLTGVTRKVPTDTIRRIGVVVGHKVASLEKMRKWPAH